MELFLVITLNNCKKKRKKAMNLFSYKCICRAYSAIRRWCCVVYLSYSFPEQILM